MLRSKHCALLPRRPTNGQLLYLEGGTLESSISGKDLVSVGWPTLIAEKAEALKARFYHTVEGDLTDILDTSFQDNNFQNSLEIPILATAKDVSSLSKGS